MSDRFNEPCAHELENLIKGLFKTSRKIPGTGMAEIPVVGGVFLPYGDYSPLLLTVCAALCAGERFRQDEPAWPPLPLHEELIEVYINAECSRLNLVGLFGKSLWGVDWNYDLHPRLGAFASGLMAYPSTPIELRNDRELLREFPPRELAGLCDGRLYWRSPETIARDREHQARCDAYNARMSV